MVRHPNLPFWAPTAMIALKRSNQSAQGPQVACRYNWRQLRTRLMAQIWTSRPNETGLESLRFAQIGDWWTIDTVMWWIRGSWGNAPEGST